MFQVCKSRTAHNVIEFTAVKYMIFWLAFKAQLYSWCDLTGQLGLRRVRYLPQLSLLRHEPNIWHVHHEEAQADTSGCN